MDYVHSDILSDILSRVPTESVLECKLVCKKWGKLLRKKYFIDVHVRHLINQLHGGGGGGVTSDAGSVDMGFLFTGKGNELNRYESLYYGGLLRNDKIIIDDDEDEICKAITLEEIINRPSMPSDMRREYLVGSCNGLICLGRYYHSLSIDPIYIFNPITGDYTYLPRFILPKGGHPGYNRLARGFGYVGSTNEYKVVRIYYDHFEDGVGQVQVYTLGSGCGWRIKSIPFPQVNHQLPGTFANGTIYWSTKDLNIHAFDLANEEHHMVSFPPTKGYPEVVHWRQLLKKGNSGFVVLGGNLCFFNQHKHESPPHIELWTLKKTDMNETWSRDFNIVYGINERCQSYADDLEPIILTKKNEVIFSCNKGTLCCYDPGTETWRIIWDEDDLSLPYDIIRVIPHVNTFVSFKALGEKNRKLSDAFVWNW